MNTFLPFPDLTASARVLSPRHLNKQISECRQILRAIQGKTKGYRYHPATLMYEDNPGFVAQFGVQCCLEQHRRTNNLHEYFTELASEAHDLRPPWWFGNRNFHVSHARILLWKEPEWYRTRIILAPSKVKPAYVWPVSRLRWSKGQDGRLMIRKKENTVTDIPCEVPPRDPCPIRLPDDHTLSKKTRVGDNEARYLLEAR